MRRGSVLAAMALVLVVIAPAGAQAASSNGKLQISVLSTKPELVTGGDALIAVTASRGAKAGSVKVRRNGSDVSSAFSPSDSNPNRLIGLVAGLRPGDNLITAYGPGVRKPASLSVYDSSIKGPVFSGPHQTPFFCRTSDSGLGAPTDADCSAPTQVSYFYRANDGTFKPLADPAGPYPADGVQTTTRDGKTVDYVVRAEKGVINRSIYRFNVLAPGGKPLDGWNRRFVYSFGGGCSAGYEQGSQGSGPGLSGPEIGEGYAILTGSLNVLGTACNDVLSAESAQMLKEHAIEELGQRPVWTMGQGGSGGSVQQQMIAQNYPGILDGIMPGASFADGSAPDYPDCRLINSYFSSTDGASLTAAQRKSITGLVDTNGCVALGMGADVVRASEGCNESVVPPAQIFDPVTNTGGIRCTVWDSLVNIYGRDPQTGYARRTLDNVGVQYGLKALADGDISVGEFLDLNEEIGGYDNNGEQRPQRAVADPQALENAYRSGRVNFTAGGYTEVPILDIRSYVDDEINVHQYINTYRTRARLEATNGNHDNQVMWRAKGGSSTKAMNDAALETLARWMDTVAADQSDKTQAEKVVADKPADAIDACWINGVRHDGPAVIGDSNICESTYPPHALPSIRAGRPLDSFVLKCQLKPIDFSEYGASFNTAQQARLAAAFPSGVCDWSKPGVEQTGIDGTWQEFGPKRVIAKRDRKLSLKVKHRGTRKHPKLKLQASMRPCPETRFQEITFERKGHGHDARWRKFDSDVAEGNSCRGEVSLRVGKNHAPAKLRARAAPVANYTAVSSATKRP